MAAGFPGARLQLGRAAGLGRAYRQPGAGALLAWLSGIAWTIFYDTIYAHQDTEDDALIGVKSTARLFGQDTHRWLAGFGTAAVLLLGLAVMATAPQGLGLTLGLLGVAGFAAHLAWQLRTLDIRDPAGCLRLFRSNRDAGLIVALFLALAGLV